MEKNSVVLLTSDDIKMYHDGVVSERVKETWGFSLTELGEVINSGTYVLLQDK